MDHMIQTFSHMTFELDHMIKMFSHMTFELDHMTTTVSHMFGSHISLVTRDWWYIVVNTDLQYYIVFRVCELYVPLSLKTGTAAINNIRTCAVLFTLYCSDPLFISLTATCVATHSA